MTDIAYTALVDQALNELAEGEKAWAATSLARRREILDDVQQLAVQHGAEAVMVRFASATEKPRITKA